GAAMELLVRQMENLGAIRSRLQAKIFGGAHVLSSVEFRFGPGPKNVAQVLEYLARYSIPVISHDTGGVMPRILHFVSDTFKIYVKKIQPTI
ncbi:MAG TPA: chemotaxis protein CheD, partial [Candidatus Ozemobacteraceae bacterium]|nr:chemotaxis protein CheD [Candidatus Ozemobacteraceae bacterium]